MNPDVIIIGAGLAGLTCARQLQSQGISFVVLESADAVGGRIRTDVVNGFRLDRGFQVFLSSYPEPGRWLDLKQLQLSAFKSGARVRYRGRFYDLSDPWRRPWTALASLFNPIGSPFDKLRVARLRWLSLRGTYAQRMQDPEQTTLAYLQSLGFGPQMIDAFLRPFLGGIFLDADLQTSSRMLNFVFRMFSHGNACLPACGMQAIPDQLAAALPNPSIRLNCPVTEIQPGVVTLQGGERLKAPKIVVATDGPAANRLLTSSAHSKGYASVHAKGRGVSCFYYSAPRPPFEDPLLVLNGDRSGPINNLCVPTNVTSTYGPHDQSLISVAVLDSQASPRTENASLEVEVRSQLREWYGKQTDGWRHLKTYTIPYALPDQTPPALSVPQRPVRLGEGIYMCGDHRDNASIEGAMVSGRRTATELAVN